MLSPVRPRKQMLTQQQRNNRRRRANPRQLAFLRKKFTEDPKPDQAAREEIGRAIDMTPRSVQIWFQNNRAKTKDQERKFSMRGRLFTMTTLACSENVSCIHAGVGDHVYGAYDGYGSSNTPAGPHRFFTPPPPRQPRILNDRSPNWWENNYSHPQLGYKLPDSQQSARLPDSMLSTYPKPRAHSEMDVRYSRLAFSRKHEDPFSFLSETPETSSQSILNNVFEQPCDSPTDVDSDSSVLGSPILSNYALTDRAHNPMPHSDTVIMDPNVNYDMDHSSDISPGSLGTCQSSTSAATDIVDPPTLAETELGLASEYIIHQDDDGGDDDDGLDTLVSALDLKMPDEPLSVAKDFVTVPCSAVWVGEFNCEGGNAALQTLVVQYSPSQHLLQITVKDTRSGLVVTLEKDVLHFPSSRNLHIMSLSCSRIDVEVFGTPRIQTVDASGQYLQAFDPTYGEIYTAHQCRLEGDFGEQLTMLRNFEANNLELSNDWLIDTEDPRQQQDEIQSIDMSLISNVASKSPESHIPKTPVTTSQPVWADQYYI